MIVTIDGPAGAGKSSIARQVADRLGFEFLDTGALYRAVTFVSLQHGIDLTDARAIIELAQQIHLEWDECHVFVDGKDVTPCIRTAEVNASIRYVADQPEVRRQLSSLQRQIADGRNIVTEGRDQGSEVFPNAECKIFLTASSEERARRRQQQLAEMGHTESYESILEAQNKRDAEDESRPVGRLRPAPDSRILNTDGMTPDDVLEAILSIVESVTQQSDA